MTALVCSQTKFLPRRASYTDTCETGTQTHISEGMGANVHGALEQLASAPVNEVAITELDIRNSPVEDYTAVVQACLDIEKCTGITVWGVSDKVSLLSSVTVESMVPGLTSRLGLLEAGRQPAALRRQLRPQGRL